MFRNRKDAAEQLAGALTGYRNKNVIVLGIPRGGVETAYYIARYLNADLSVVITRKLGYPINPEAAFGAIAEDGSIYISPYAEQELTGEEMRAVMNEQKEEIIRRVKKLRRGKPLPNLEGRTVIIADDGIATGATLFATIELRKKKGAGKIVVASPIASPQMVQTLKDLVDDVVVLVTPSRYYAVSQGYENFDNLSDEEAIAFLERWEKENLLFHK